MHRIIRFIRIRRNKRTRLESSLLSDQPEGAVWIRNNGTYQRYKLIRYTFVTAGNPLAYQDETDL